jgi:hypothetical protein
MHEGIVGGQCERQNCISSILLTIRKYWKVSMKVQLTQNLNNITKTKPKLPKNTTFKVNPAPSLGNKERLAFW